MSAEGAGALAVDDAHLCEPLLVAGAQVLGHEAAHVGGVEDVKVQDAVNRVLFHRRRALAKGRSKCDGDGTDSSVTTGDHEHADREGAALQLLDTAKPVVGVSSQSVVARAGIARESMHYLSEAAFRFRARGEAQCHVAGGRLAREGRPGAAGDGECLGGGPSQGAHNGFLMNARRRVTPSQLKPTCVCVGRGVDREAEFRGVAGLYPRA